jgi:hypothetical protein
MSANRCGGTSFGTTVYEQNLAGHHRILLADVPGEEAATCRVCPGTRRGASAEEGPSGIGEQSRSSSTIRIVGLLAVTWLAPSRKVALSRLPPALPVRYGRAGSLSSKLLAR